MSVAKPKLIRQIACDILARAEKYQSFVNILLDDRFKRYRHLSAHERALITEMVYGVLRNRRLIDLVIARFSKVKPEKMERRTLLALRLGTYQVVFMRKIPDALAVNDSVNLVRQPSRPLTNAILRTLCRQKNQVENIIDGLLNDYPVAQKLALRHSHPDWLVERWIARFGLEFTERWLQKNNEPAPLFVRVNSLKITSERLADKLRAEGLAVTPCGLLPNCLIIEGASSLGEQLWIKQGLGVIQDAASQLVGFFVDPKEGELILDACAAPGTKTTHIAQLVQDRAKIVATDISDAKLKLLRDSAARLGLSSIETVQADLTSKILLEANMFDKVLVDAPCANLGLLRRHPEIRWQRAPDDLTAMAEVQLKILNAVASLPKRGGFLIYSVCSISNEENEGVVTNFLRENPNYEVAEPPEAVKRLLPDAIGKDEAVRTFPHLHNSDGFFIIRMRRIR